jgi:hypothetical protein
MSNSNYQAEIVSFERAAPAQRELDLGIVEMTSAAERVVWATASTQSKNRVVWATASAQSGTRVVWATASKQTAGRVVWATASNGAAQGRVSIAA